MRLILFILFLSCSSIMFGQQIPQYSNFSSIGNYQNSCYSRLLDDNEMGIGYRYQWVGFDNAPRSGFMTYSHQFDSTHSGGIHIMYDKVGVLNHSYVSLNYSYSLRIKKDAFLSFGISPSIEFSNINGNELILANQVDNTINSSAMLSSQLFDVNSTIQYSDESFYVFFSAMNLLTSGETPNTALTDFNLLISHSRHYYFSTGYIIEKENVSIVPSILMKVAEYSPLQTQVNFKTKYKDFGWLILGYRTNDAVIIGGGINLKKKLVLDYTYDITTSKLRNYNSGSHEFILRYLISN